MAPAPVRWHTRMARFWRAMQGVAAITFFGTLGYFIISAIRGHGLDPTRLLILVPIGIVWHFTESVAEESEKKLAAAQRENCEEPVAPVVSAARAPRSPDPLDTECWLCGKTIGPGGLRGPMMMRGDDLFKLMEARATYRCKQCGTPFCMACMAKLKGTSGIPIPCPACGNGHGW